MNRRWRVPGTLALAPVARLGALEHRLDHPTLLAERDGHLLGPLTYVVRRAECEVLACTSTTVGMAWAQR